MLLQGSLSEFSLPNVLQLVKMSGNTGVLTLRREGQWGRLYFRDGNIYFAFVDPQAVPLGERLVRVGAITPVQLEEGLTAQREHGEGARLGAVLVALGHLDRGALAEAVADQIEESAFSLLGWTEGEFEFTGGGCPADEDIVVEMTVDGLIIEGCRRIDEWDLIMASLGSLQHVPRLEFPEALGERGGVSFTTDEWRVVSLVDGRRDAGSVIRDSGLNRFLAAKTLHRLVVAEVVRMRPASIEGIESGKAVIVRGQIDFYTEVFLGTVDDESMTRHLLALTIDEQEVEVPMVAVTLAGSQEDEEHTLVFALGSGSYEPAWQELAARCSAGIVLVNANSRESVRASVADIAAFRQSERLPLVVATYVSVTEDPVSADVVRRELALPEQIPVLDCELRDRDAVLGAVATALTRAEAARAAGGAQVDPGSASAVDAPH